MALSLKDRKVQLGIAGGVVAILALFLVLKVVGGGGSPSAGSSPITLPSGAGPSVSPSPTPKPPPVIVFSGRDPFQDLFGPATSGTGTGTPTPTGSGTGTPTPTPTGTGTPTPTPTGTGDGSGDGQGSGATIGGHSVLLDDIFIAQGGVRKAQVEVDGTVYTVAAGQSFDDNFKLVSFPSASCAHFVFGDEGFTLCTSGGK